MNLLKAFKNLKPYNRDVTRVLALMWFFSLIGILMMLIPSKVRFISEGWTGALKCLAVCLFTAGASVVSGTMLGFLFGVPKINYNSDKPDQSEYIPNTNLELISDWLTKIIVGVSLVQLPNIIENFKTLGEYVGPAIGDHPIGEILTIAIIIHYLIIGFIQGFILAYLWLPNAFNRAKAQFPEQKENK